MLIIIITQLEKYRYIRRWDKEFKDLKVEDIVCEKHCNMCDRVINYREVYPTIGVDKEICSECYVLYFEDYEGE